MTERERAAVELSGAFLTAFAAAGQSLQLLLNPEELQTYDLHGWYPLAEWERLTGAISRYEDPAPIFTRLGIEMIHSMFQGGPLTGRIGSTIEFLEFQADAAGYRNSVRGPIEQTGTAELLLLDEDRGMATIRDTSMFNDEMVEGVFLGGMSLFDDHLYSDVAVRNVPGDRFVDIRFVTEASAATTAGPRGDLLSPTEWRFLQLANESARSERYWSSINSTLNAAFEELRIIATRDPLTGLLNRREFMRQIEAEFARHRRHLIPVTVLYMDLDQFKAVNDGHGHDVGDSVLRAFAGACDGASRENDVFGRIGGEEFAAFLPHTTLDRGEIVAQRIVERVRDLAVPAGDATVRVTVSVGVAEAEPGQSLEVLLKVADERLLQAKRGGRDQVVAG